MVELAVPLPLAGLAVLDVPFGVVDQLRRAGPAHVGMHQPHHVLHAQAAEAHSLQRFRVPSQAATLPQRLEQALPTTPNFAPVEPDLGEPSGQNCTFGRCPCVMRALGDREAVGLGSVDMGNSTTSKAPCILTQTQVFE